MANRCVSTRIVLSLFLWIAVRQIVMLASKSYPYVSIIFVTHTSYIPQVHDRHHRGCFQTRPAAAAAATAAAPAVLLLVCCC